MTHTPPRGEIRLSTTLDYDEPVDIPLLGLRGRDRPVLTPETCRMRDCPICQWQREGLLDYPGRRRAA